MLCVCVVDVMDVVFSVCILRRGAVGGFLIGFLSVVLNPSSLCYIP